MARKLVGVCKNLPLSYDVVYIADVGIHEKGDIYSSHTNRKAAEKSIQDAYRYKRFLKIVETDAHISL